MLQGTTPPDVWLRLLLRCIEEPSCQAAALRILAQQLAGEGSGAVHRAVSMLQQHKLLEQQRELEVHKQSVAQQQEQILEQRQQLFEHQQQAGEQAVQVAELQRQLAEHKQQAAEQSADLQRQLQEVQAVVQQLLQRQPLGAE